MVGPASRAGPGIASNLEIRFVLALGAAIPAAAQSCSASRDPLHAGIKHTHLGVESRQKKREKDMGILRLIVGMRCGSHGVGRGCQCGSLPKSRRSLKGREMRMGFSFIELNRRFKRVQLRSEFCCLTRGKLECGIRCFTSCRSRRGTVADTGMVWRSAGAATSTIDTESSALRRRFRICPGMRTIPAIPECSRRPTC